MVPILITGGQTTENAVIRQLVDIYVSQGETLTPYQMAKMADRAREVAKRNAVREQSYIKYRLYGELGE